MSKTKKYTLTISDSARAALNAEQIKFIEMAYARISDIEDQLDMDLTPPEIRLYYLKDLFTIFNELLKIKEIKRLDKTDDLTRRRLTELIHTVDFIRNILLHFPLFKTWDDIYISREFNSGMGGSKGGRIHKFLHPETPMESLAFKLTMEKNMGEREFTIRFPDQLALEGNIYIKDILTEKEGAISIITVMNHIF
jgi:hypothetical protein